MTDKERSKSPGPVGMVPRTTARGTVRIIRKDGTIKAELDVVDIQECEKNADRRRNHSE